MIRGILVDAMATSAPARVTVRSGMQPDSLKLASQLAILKLLHRTALSLDERLGDKSSGRTSFIKGIQGEVTDPTLIKALMFNSFLHR